MLVKCYHILVFQCRYIVEIKVRITLHKPENLAVLHYETLTPQGIILRLTKLI